MGSLITSSMVRPVKERIRRRTRWTTTASCGVAAILTIEGAAETERGPKGFMGPNYTA